MKNILPFLLLPLLISCGPDSSEARALVVRSKAPQPQEGALPGPSPQDRALPPVQIPIPDSIRVLDVMGVNLDRDSDEEQLILVMNRDNLSSLLTLYVADYDVTRKTYFKSWEAQTLARANEPYRLSLEDLIGDHSRVVIMEGLDETGRQTLNLYRQEQGTAAGTGISLTSIMELASGGSLAINRETRSQAYELGQKNEESFSVVAETTPVPSSSILEIRRDIYQWRFQEGKYVLARTETAVQDLKSDSALAEILKRSDEELITFLTGPWYFSGTPENPGPNSRNEYLSFDPREKLFSFFSGTTMEQYNWQRTTRTTRASLLITGSNNLVGSNLIMTLALTVQSPDTLAVEIRGNSSWSSGLYGKLPASTQKILLSTRDSANYQRKGLSGLYRNEHGQEVNFDLPFFTRVDQGIKSSGSVSLFDLGGKVIQLKTLDENGQSLKVENYLFTLDEEKRDLRTIRTLKLYPGKLAIGGFEPYNQDFIKLEQTEVTSSSEQR